MDKFLSMLEAPWPQQQDDFDAEKVRFMNSKISIWDFYGIPQANYLSYSVEKKSKMFKKYYLKLLEKHYGSTGKKNFFVWFGLSGEPFSLLSDFWSDIFLVLFLAMQHTRSTEIDSGFSQAIRDSNKISMTKTIFSDNRVETAITAKKTSFKSNTIDVWPDYGYFKQQPCDFGIEKEHFPENSIFYLNQGYQSVKGNKKNLLCRYIFDWSS